MKLLRTKEFPLAAAVELDRQVVVDDVVVFDGTRVGVVHEETAAVVDHEVGGRADPAHGLKEDSIGAEAATSGKGVAREDDVFRVHQGCPGDILFEEVVVEAVLVRVHVVEAVSNVVDVVAMDLRLVGEGEIDPIAHVEDLVVQDPGCRSSSRDESRCHDRIR